MANSAFFDGDPYDGPIVIQTLVDGTYAWKVDNKRFTFHDYSSITEEDIPNPYYRLGIVGAVSNSSATILPVPATPVAPNTYRIWNFVPPDQIPGGNKLSTPYAVNYRGIDLTKRLHPRTWKVHGLVVQVIHYDDYDAATDTYITPIVRERWIWDLDSETNLAISRTINIEWYGAQDDLTDPENPVPTIIGPAKEYKKHYSVTSNKVLEIQRRRINVVNDLQETVIGLLAMTETSGNVLSAITLGQALMTEVNSLVADYTSHGDDDLANGISTEGVRANHPWLNNDCAAAGMPGVTIYQVMYNALTEDISDAIAAFSFDSIPAY